MMEAQTDGAENVMECADDGRIQGYLYRIDGRTLVGPARKKVWCVLLPDSPILYNFKTSTDLTCSGRIPLFGAAFTFNPREPGRFEIHVDNSVYVLEASSSKSRMEWLRHLQRSRKRYYGREGTADVSELARSNSSDVHFGKKAVAIKETHFDGRKTSSSTSEIDATEKACTHDDDQISPNSTFYVDTDGEINVDSFKTAATSGKGGKRTSVDELVSRLVEEGSGIMDSLRGGSSTTGSRRSARRFSPPLPVDKHESQAANRTPCEKCGQSSPAVDQLRTRCYELSDELIAKEELVNTLKRAVLTAHNQRDSLLRRMAEKRGEEDIVTHDGQLEAMMEREERMVQLQFALSEARRENEDLKEDNRKLESENLTMNTMIEAFRQSVQTKDELILKFCGDGPQPSVSNITSGFDTTFGTNSNTQLPDFLPEAIAVDFGSTPTDRTARQLFEEACVSDVSEMKDLVDGYRTQNEFLNNEVLELQHIVQSLEDRERRLVRQNFNLEALFYQLKSKYMMVLNHFRSSDHPKRALEPSMINELIAEVGRPHSSAGGRNSSDSPFPSTAVRNSPPIFIGRGLPLPRTISTNVETDQLGFYFGSPSAARQRLTATASGPASYKDDATLSTSLAERDMTADGSTFDVLLPVLANSLLSTATTSDVPAASTKQLEHEGGGKDDWMLRMAGDLRRRADNIWTNVDLEHSKEYIDWLLKWDELLVNYVQQPSLPGQKFKDSLKTLIRQGVPHAYRGRVWKSIVDQQTANAQAETGKGYYECLVKRAEKIQEDDTQSDAALKQVDLDLIRTLPNNRLFDTENSAKTQALKGVLYAFRFHNKQVAYCQGLNRVAAIGLLYLQELDAFWFLVSCVEHLQPPDYYTPTLMGAVVDQKILMDLVQERLPTLWAHLRHLGVDLSLFTLSWFITIFVDALPHSLYINIFDIFLYEGNKVLFRFALALLKLCEPKLMSCNSLGSVHACLSALTNTCLEFRTLADVAFNQLNPFPSKWIESRRSHYTNQFKAKSAK